MRFENCIERRLVKIIEPNKESYSSLFKLASIRLENIHALNNPTLKVESYYEIIKDILTALLYLKGYKSYSHECLIIFARENINHKLSGMELELIDQLRILRNDITYRGAFIEDDFLDRNEKNILSIIKTLKSIK
jgi:hypothetical protein